MSGYISMFKGPGGGVCLISFFRFFINDDGGGKGGLVCGWDVLPWKVRPRCSVRRGLLCIVGRAGAGGGGPPEISAVPYLRGNPDDVLATCSLEQLATTSLLLAS